MVAAPHLASDHNMPFMKQRCDLAAAFRWAERLNLHEAVANHFSLAVDDSGKRFLMNPNQRHFSRIRASDILLLDADDPATMTSPNAPDPTAWGLHGAVHRHCPHARCVLHAHPVYSTVLASLADSTLPPIDQNSAAFYERHVVDETYGGLAFEDEAERCVTLLSDPKIKVMVMGNHGIMVLGDDVADAFDRLYYFERAAENYVKALWTGQPLRRLSHEVASRTAEQIESYPSDGKHFGELVAILDEEGSNFRE
ncbi:class II aldolase and adducin N-terminal domain-containing protein [Pelagibius sp. 7325]|uniref:class II aldolase and adducin N-terminal domain-containing protein n=1 Tax=Pelagibius sp. 7325 TaxID=3131994 RepID=UPI0030ED40F1